MTAREPLVLVVDDYAVNRELYTEYLTFSRFRVATAADGEEAVARAGELRPDAIVMDLGLPVLDGWQATRQLKRDPRTRNIPIIVLTGYTQEDHAQAAREAGCDAFLPKPCLSGLVVELRRLLGTAPRPARASPVARKRGRRSSG